MERCDVRRAWETFHNPAMSHGPPLTTLVRPAVLASWQRSKQHCIAVTRLATTVVTEAELHRRRQHSTMVLHAARPALERAREFLAGANSMAVLTDSAGVILETEGDDRAVDLGCAISLQRGGRWMEAEIGTNAIGTALALNAPVQIHAAEHFCSEVQKWTCAAAPVRHPFTHEVLGVLDISGPAGTFSPQSLAHAVAMAQHIEGLVGRMIEAEHDHVLRHFLSRRSLWMTEDVVAFGRNGALIYSTDKALREITRRNPELLVGGRLACLQGIEPTAWPSHIATLLQGVSVEVVTKEGLQLGGVLVLHDRRRNRPKACGDRNADASFESIRGESQVMQDTRDKARRMAASGVPVLLEGETGVGKELFARAIHAVRIPSGPFIPVNCGGLPRDLVSSEIFGYAKGAFTGADSTGRAGKMEAAHGGVLCLDEIGEMPFELQSYLLRVLEDGIVYRIGSHEGCRVEVRLVSMTNRDLATEVAAGRFRQDLYYRIATLRLRIPPLRERSQDIVPLLEHFGQLAARRAQCAPPHFTSAALDRLCAYAWPGNIRELRNFTELSAVMSPIGVIGADDLPAEFQHATTPLADPHPNSNDLRTMEEAAITAAVKACGGNFTRAAKRLGIARSTLYTRAAALASMKQARLS